MKKTNYFIIALLSIFMLITQVNAERKSIIIEGSEDDYANSAIIAENGSFAVVGEFSSRDIEGLTNNGGYDAFIVKYNQYGEQQWIKNFGGSDDDSFYDVLNTPDNGFIAVGYTCSTDTENITTKGSCDAIAVKYDSDGNIEWQQNYGTKYDEKFNTIKKSTDGTYLLAGLTLNNGYLVRIDEKGVIKFETSITSYDITFVIEKNDGGYYVGEYTQHSRLRSLDEDFTQLWNVQPRDGTYTYVNDAVLLEDDSIVIVGTRIESDTRIAYISKYNANGTLLWTADYGSVHEAFNSIKIDEDGNYIITGGKKTVSDEETTIDALIIKYDSEGKIISEEKYQTEKATWFYGMDHVSKNGYVYVGSTYVRGESLKDDILIVFDMQDFIYNIKTTVDGKGTVEVVPNSKAGEKITFKVTPEEGYVLNKVIVTDEFGNTVTFTDYTFTMPSADVTIEVKFDKIEESKNPETADIFVIYFVITALVSTILLLSSKKKLNWMK